MKTTIIYTLIAVFAVLIIINKLLGSKHAFFKSVFSASEGLAALFATAICSQTLGINMPLNVFSIASAALLGIPGVSTMAVLNTFLF